MSDWKDEIKTIHDKYNQRRVEVTSALNKLTIQLKTSTKIHSESEKIGDHPLVWKVKIGDKEFNITELEISDKQMKSDGWGGKTEEPEKELEEVLKEILIDKYKY